MRLKIGEGMPRPTRLHLVIRTAGNTPTEQRAADPIWQVDTSRVRFGEDHLATASGPVTQPRPLSAEQGYLRLVL